MKAGDPFTYENSRTRLDGLLKWCKQNNKKDCKVDLRDLENLLSIETVAERVFGLPAVIDRNVHPNTIVIKDANDYIHTITLPVKT